MAYPQHLSTLLRYKAWADRLLFQALADVPAAALTAAQPIVFGSLLRTLHHVYAMDLVWQSHLLGVPHGFLSRNPEDCPDFAAQKAAQAAMDEWYVSYAAGLVPAALDEVVEFVFIGGGHGAMRREDILLHVANHATYHRGHVAMMMYQLQVPPPTTDLPVFLREQAGA
jgi:uncharacterized damage-inducible protein DinB